MKKNEEIWLQTQNPRRFPGFTVVVVTFFVEILDDFHDVSFGMCLSRRESTTNLGVSPFFLRKVAIFIGRETEHTFYRRKLTEKSLRSAPLTIIILLEYYNPFNNTTTTADNLDVGEKCKESVQNWDGRLLVHILWLWHLMLRHLGLVVTRLVGPRALERRPLLPRLHLCGALARGGRGDA